MQLIERQGNRYTLIVNGMVVIFVSPMSLFVGNNVFPSKCFVPRGKSVVKWKVGGMVVSYNQIKKCIRNGIDVVGK